jgi:DNA-3-methyladenine glycosylase II
MSTRRSARLGTASTASTELPKESKEIAPSKVANVGRKRKAPTNDAVEVPKSSDATPSTPKRKKAAKPPPDTPTPAAIGLMSMSYSSGDIDDMAPPPVNRLAIPNGTNAALLTPETHRLVANKPIDQVSPSKLSRVQTSSANILEEALEHIIKVDPKLKPLIEQHTCHVFSPEGLAEEIDPFRSLVSGIISQQV